MIQLPELLLTLFIVNLGIAFGAGLYETRVILPRWFPRLTTGAYGVDTTAMAQLESGRHFWAFVTTGPLTLLTLVNLYLAWHSTGPVHDWWLAAGLITLIERTGTFAFFIPTAIKLQRADQFSLAEKSRLVSLWKNANWLRSLLNLAAWLLALTALAL